MPVDLLHPSNSQKSQCLLTCYSPVIPRKVSACWLVAPQYFPEKSVPVDLLLPSNSQTSKWPCVDLFYSPVIPRQASGLVLTCYSPVIPRQASGLVLTCYSPVIPRQASGLVLTCYSPVFPRQVSGLVLTCYSPVLLDLIGKLFFCSPKKTSRPHHVRFDWAVVLLFSFISC